MKIKEAIILAGGVGKRLDAMNTPKPLVFAHDKPLIVWNIQYLLNVGVNKIIIVTKKGDTDIQKNLLSYADFANKLLFAPQKKTSDSMLNSLLAAEKIVKGPVFVTACDLIFDKNPYNYFSAINNRKETDIVVLSSIDRTHNELSGAQSRLYIKNGVIKKVGRKIKNSNGYDTGLYLFGLNAWNDVMQFAVKNKKEHLDGLLQKFAVRGRLIAAKMDKNEWYDVNTPKTLIRADLFLKNKFAPSKVALKKDVETAPLTSTFHFQHRKKIETDIIVKRGIIDNIGKYKIIPYDYFESPHYIITDEKVDKLYGDSVLTSLKARGYKINKIVTMAGEAAKSIENYTELANRILAGGIDENSVIISLGGGVINNLAGFLAATLYRGIGLIHIPTNLMSQCDAAIGIKQAINTPKGKNLIGSFYEPMRIIVDPTLLLKLSSYNLRDGLAECIKHAVSQDSKFYKYLSEYAGPIHNINFLENVIKNNIKLKLKLMERDFKEEKEAAVLQYGHQIGHAVEYLSGYKYGHGEAISIGMRVSAELSCILGISSQNEIILQKQILEKYKLPTRIPKEMSTDDIITALRYDKKYRGGDVRFGLVDKIGSLWHAKGAYTIPCKDALIKKAIQNSYE